MKRIYVQLDEQAKMVGNEDISPSQIEVICTVDPSYDSKKSAEAVLEFLEFLPINTLKEFIASLGEITIAVEPKMQGRVIFAIVVRKK